MGAPTIEGTDPRAGFAQAAAFDTAAGPGRRRKLSGWGRFPRENCRVIEPISITALREAVACPGTRDCIPRGLGRSYGDSALNETGVVLSQTRLNRFLAFDEETGILECEGGVSLAEIIEHFLPRGWFLPTTPGTQYVTVGGAIAADVHGKDHHVNGSFGHFVLSLRLLVASGEVIDASPAQHPDVFWATVGGMGLTGVITSARIQLRPVGSPHVDLTVRRTLNLDASLETFAKTDDLYRYSVAWIDCLASGRSLGRSVILLANDAPVDDLSVARPTTSSAMHRSRTLKVPFDIPSFVLNRWSVRAFNALYYARHRDGHSRVDYESFFYPLDRVRDWNRVYGRRGFIQYQALFPRHCSREGLIELLERVAKSRRASFLAVLKSSGPTSQGLLSYLYPGHTLALDLPFTGSDLLSLTHELDEIVLRYGGRLYLAKDATTSAEALAAMYPQLEKFRQIKSRIDPERRFLSSQARRVGILLAT